MSISWKGALPLSSHFEMHFLKGSAFCISQRVSLQSSMRDEGAFTLSVFDVDLTYVGGVISVDVSVLLQVQVVGPSRVDVSTMLLEAFEVTGVSLTSTNHERQSAALLWAPDIYSKVMLYVLSSSDHLFTLLFAFLPFRNVCRGLWLLCTTMSDPCI